MENPAILVDALKGNRCAIVKPKIRRYLLLSYSVHGILIPTSSDADRVSTFWALTFRLALGSLFIFTIVVVIFVHFHPASSWLVLLLPWALLLDDIGQARKRRRGWLWLRCGSWLL
jgi:hypothetical protein